MSEAKHKMLEVTISGTYHNSKKEIFDFEDVKGFIPYTDEDRAKMHVKRRYAATWVREAVDENGKKIYDQRVDRIRTVYFDDIEEVEGELSFIGKDIKKMSFKELQDLATAKDLRLIPVEKEDMRMARIRAYVAYSEIILGRTFGKDGNEWKEEKFINNFMKEPEIIVEDANATVIPEKISNEEIIDQEMSSESTKDDPRTRFTLPELKKLADDKKIPYAVNIGFDAMYKKLYG